MTEWLLQGRKRRKRRAEAKGKLESVPLGPISHARKTLIGHLIGPLTPAQPAQTRTNLNQTSHLKSTAVRGLLSPCVSGLQNQPALFQASTALQRGRRRDARGGTILRSTAARLVPVKFIFESGAIGPFCLALDSWKHWRPLPAPRIA